MESGHVDEAAVIRRPLPGPQTPVAPSAVPGGSSEPAAQSALEVPPNALYVCVVHVGAVRKRTAIEFSSKVWRICAKHLEMGPCQYERNACRRRGGRVYTADGKEITLGTEAEYDKKVLRVRFNAG